MCTYHDSFRINLLKHFQLEHNISISTENFKFDNIEYFTQWKNDLEATTDTKFVKIGSEKQMITYYSCHRSGYYVSRGKGSRHLKSQGSKKINSFCPASIQLIQSNNQFEVIFVSTHVGHKTELGHLTLTQTNREMLASKIAARVPFPDILDDVRGSLSESNLQRIHLLTRKDLYNIQSSFNLCSSSVRHPSDGLSVDSWVTEMQKTDNCVLYYKPQGTVSEEHLQLKSEDFVLIIMNEAQCEILKKYGSDCICLDGTHGMNSYNFELNTLLVIDGLRQGFPGAFLISNRTDKEIFKLFFFYVKQRTGVISPKVFMSDMAEAFFTAWIEEMKMPDFR